ncbi:conserved hypothetical protein [Alphaproteobacteria bacterium]
MLQELFSNYIGDFSELQIYSKLRVVRRIVFFAVAASIALCTFIAIFHLRDTHALEAVSDVQDENAYSEHTMLMGNTHFDKMSKIIGGSICLYLNHDCRTSGVHCKSVTSLDTIQSIKDLQSSNINLLIVRATWQKTILNGTDVLSSSGPYDSLRFVLSLYDEGLAVLVRSDSKVKNFNDLRKQSVSIGEKSSATNNVMNTLMEIKHWQHSDFNQVLELSPQESMRALCNGDIDAMAVLDAHPSSYLKEVTRLCEVNMLDIDDKDVAEFIASNNDYKVVTIKGGTYLGIPLDVKTMGVKATLVTTSDTAEASIYHLTKTLLSRLDKFKTLHESLSNLSIDSMINEGRVAPMHPGVTKYLEEIKYDLSKLTTSSVIPPISPK